MTSELWAYFKELFGGRQGICKLKFDLCVRDLNYLNVFRKLREIAGTRNILHK